MRPILAVSLLVAPSVAVLAGPTPAPTAPPAELYRRPTDEIQPPSMRIAVACSASVYAAPARRAVAGLGCPDFDRLVHRMAR